AIALARPADGPHSVDHGRLDLDEALAPIALHGPPCCALGQRRGDGVIGRISKGDANHLRALDPGRAVISWRGRGQCPVRLARWQGVRVVSHARSGLADPPPTTRRSVATTRGLIL